MLVEVGQKRSVTPLTPWELPKLLEPMPRWKRRKRGKGPAVWRPHFLPILAFVYRNRFAVASQIQRRFLSALPSDRTARRHLAELEATGCLSVADTRSTSPLFPKVYFVTGRGVRKVEEALRERDKPGRCCRGDRRRPEAYSPDHVLHEILTTEFLLNVWQATQPRDDLELLAVQRRALERHRSFLVDMGQPTRLKPDAMFLYRENGGLMCCFLEMDNGTMSMRQIRSKFARYDAWAQSSYGKEYLLSLYRAYDAVQVRPAFRVLLVARSRLAGGDSRRVDALQRTAKSSPIEIRSRLWLTTVDELQTSGAQALGAAIWRRGAAGRTGDSDQRHSLFAARTLMHGREA